MFPSSRPSLVGSGSDATIDANLLDQEGLSVHRVHVLGEDQQILDIDFAIRVEVDDRGHFHLPQVIGVVEVVSAHKIEGRVLG